MAHPYENLAEIYADILLQFPDNDTRQITPEHVRHVLDGIVEFFGRKTPFYTNIVHTGDANYSVTDASFILILDDISAIRTVNIPAVPPTGNGTRLLMFVIPTPGLTYWQTSEPFYDGNAMRQQLGNGRQELLYDEVGGRWILIGGL